jgi:hypothetical protein
LYPITWFIGRKKILLYSYDVTGKLEALYEDPDHNLQQYIPEKDIELEECPAYAEIRKDDIKLEECPAYGQHPILWQGDSDINNFVSILISRSVYSFSLRQLLTLF